MNKQSYENAQKTNKMWEQICRQALNLWKIVRLFFVKVFWTGDAIYIREQYDKMSFPDITNEHQRLQRSEATNWSTVFMLFSTEEDIGCLNVYVSSCCIINVKILYKWQKILHTL